MRGIVVLAALGGLGTALLLSVTRAGRRRSLTHRLRPYAPGGLAPATREGVLSIDSFRDVIAPLARALGARVGRLFGVTEDLETKLLRTHADIDVTGFRTRQLVWAAAGLLSALVVAAGLPLPSSVRVLLVVGVPLLAFLVLEHEVGRRSADWQRRLFLEAPVVAEQIGLLLSAGYSLSGALLRVAQRSQGAAARDLARVTARVRQGLSETDALREWAALAQVEAVDRLVMVLALNREAGDLGRLISDEARAMRRDAQRDLVEQIEARGQQVWIPVTVATLVPGVIFIAVPFLQALSLFSAS